MHEWLLTLIDDDLVDIYSAHLECQNSKNLCAKKQLLGGGMFMDEVINLVAVKIDRGYGLISMARISVAGK